MSATCGWVETAIRYKFLACFLLAGTLSADLDACPYETAEDTHSSAFAAGCLVRSEGKMLVVRHKFSGKLGIPAGYSDGLESARCTAYRETLEETGLEVRVHEMLEEFDDGFRLFRCSLADYIPTSDPVDVPASGIAEISEVIWFEPDSAPQRQWRFPEQHPALMLLFDALSSQ